MWFPFLGTYVRQCLRFERKFTFDVATIIRQEGRHERTVASAAKDRTGRS